MYSVDHQWHRLVPFDPVTVSEICSGSEEITGFNMTAAGITCT